jgi:small-conductance mechanosensitive channel
MKRFFIFLLLLIATGSFGTHAASLPEFQAPRTVDIYRLTHLYEELLDEHDRLPWEKREGKIEEIEDVIADELLSVRLLVETELNALVTPKDIEETLDPEKSLDRQRSVIAALQDRIKERKVDLALLQKEELLYKEGVLTQTGRTAGVVQITDSYPELLARKAILQERIQILTQLIQKQQERGRRLEDVQRRRDVMLLLTILAYIGVFLGVLWVERFIRTVVLVLIPHRTIRYAVTKTFTIVIYLALIFWFAQEIISEFPNILTAFAFIGAAMIIATQDVIKAFIGWLTQSQNLAIGNRVTIGTPIGSMTGDVVDLSVLFTSLLVSRTQDLNNVSQVGKIVRVPNAYLLLQPVVNYNSTSDFIRVELPITVSDPSKADHARTIFEEVLKDEVDVYFETAHKQIQKRTRRFYFPLEFHSSCVFAEPREGGILFTLCCTAPIRKRREIVTKLTEAILRRCESAGIDIVGKAGTPRAHSDHAGESHSHGAEDVVLGHGGGGSSPSAPHHP